MVKQLHKRAKPEPRRNRFGAGWWLCLLLVLTSLGCRSSNFLTVRRVPRSPLEGPLQLVSYRGPQPSGRTEQLLRRFALNDIQAQKPQEVLNHLRTDILTDPSPEKIYSYAELSFIAAKKAEAGGHEGDAIDHYAGAVANAYLFLFSPGFDRSRNPYDPQFRQACDLYNGSLEGVLRMANKRGALRPGQAELITTGKQKYHVNIVMRGAWRAEEIEKLEFVSDYEIQGGLKNQYHTYGLGVPMIAVRRKLPQDQNAAAKYYPPGLSFATTAFLRVVMPAVNQSSDEVCQCVLELHDPLVSSDIAVNGRIAPLETDLTIPLGYFLDSPDFKERDTSTLGLFNPEQAEMKGLKGLFLLEPYDPKRIPVVMVHGLWSSPITWMEMFNDLRAFPEIREKYQFMFYLYPTGKPFWESSTQFREALAELQRDLNPENRNPTMNEMVLVGHSMGGLLSFMQTLESGDHFWNILSDKSFVELKGETATKEHLAKMVYFHPNPAVKRVVTLGTPFHGSDFANDYTRWAGRYLISLPKMMEQLTNKVTRDNPNFFRDTALLTTNTSIDSLSQKSPIFPVLHQAQRNPNVKYHNIIGLISQDYFVGRFAPKGDGVVAYEDARLAQVESEMTVPADHLTVHRHPKSVLELRRILLEHWEIAGIPLVSTKLPASFRLVGAQEEDLAPRFAR
jgi:pimeloyl-ACP methyl ester carboxylesterase